MIAVAVDPPVDQETPSLALAAYDLLHADDNKYRSPRRTAVWHRQATPTIGRIIAYGPARRQG